MAEHCKNCNELIERHFCTHCGQKKYKRIDKKYILDEVQYTFLHANKGLLFSVKNIIKNPGKTAREFIDGNRVNHYKPILLAFVLTGISTFLSIKVLHLNEAVGTAYKGNKYVNVKAIEEMMEFTSHYNSLIMMALVPFFALTTFIPFRKWGQNYYEHIVMNAYFLSLYMLVNIIIVDPIVFIFKNRFQENIFNIVSYVLLLVPFLLVWFYRGFYPDKPIKSIILKILAVFGLFLAGYIVFSILGGIIFIIYALSNNPQMLQQVKPH